MEVIINDEVKRFIRSLQRPTEAKLSRLIVLLSKYGQDLGMPRIKYVTQGMYELRIRGQQEVRVFCIFHKKQAYLLHGFIKKTQKTPKKELEIAMRKKQELT